MPSDLLNKRRFLLVWFKDTKVAVVAAAAVLVVVEVVVVSEAKGK